MFDLKGAYGTIVELDYSGTADWNPHGIRPATRFVLHLPGDPITPACRLTTFRAHDEQEGVHWPHKVGDVCLILFLGIDAPIAIACNTSDDIELPDDAETVGSFTLYGHTIRFEEEGLTIQTEDEKAILLKDDYISIAHPEGQTVVLDGDGNISVTVPGDLGAEIEGSVDITAQGTVTIGGKLGVELNTENKISLKTLGLLAGIVNDATHKVCYITGAPIGASQTVEAGS